MAKTAVASNLSTKLVYFLVASAALVFGAMLLLTVLHP